MKIYDLDGNLIPSSEWYKGWAKYEGAKPFYLIQNYQGFSIKDIEMSIDAEGNTVIRRIEELSTPEGK